MERCPVLLKTVSRGQYFDGKLKRKVKRTTDQLQAEAGSGSLFRKPDRFGYYIYNFLTWGQYHNIFGSEAFFISRVQIVDIGVHMGIYPITFPQFAF